MDIAKVVERFAGLRVGVLGDVMLDRYLFGEVERISPEAPVPVIDAIPEKERELVGGAANVAANLALAGAKVHLFGVVGDDSPGEKLRALVASAGITAHLAVDPHRHTTVKTRVVARSQQVLRIDQEDRGDVPGAIASKLVESLGEVELDALILEDYDKGVLSGDVIGGARDTMASRLVAVDPKQAHFAEFTDVGLLKPNRREFREFTRAPDDLDSLARAARELARTMRVRFFLLTVGPEGALACEDGVVTHVPALALEVFDVTGAGDTVIAYATLGLLAGADFTDAAMLACLAGGIKVRKFGASPVGAEELVTVASAEWEGMEGRRRKLL